MSALLFALSVEPFAAAIWRYSDIHGLDFAHEQHKLMLYAGNIMLVLTDPLTSLLRLTYVLRSFHEVLGFIINISKSEVIGIALSDQTWRDLVEAVSFYVDFVLYSLSWRRGYSLS